MSEFGKGLTYCLGLFLCHSERDYGDNAPEIITRAGLWFNGAGDHLFELEIPKTLPSRLKSRIRLFQKKVLKWRISLGDPKPTKEDKDWAINEAKSLLRSIDRTYGVKVKKGDWQ